MPWNPSKRWPKKTDAEWLQYVRDHSDVNKRGCWIWRSNYRTYNGYVQASIAGKVWRVHRFTYTLNRRRSATMASRRSSVPQHKGSL